MRQETNFDLVREFHEKFNCDINEEFSYPLIDLRFNLIDEEVNEVYNELYPLNRVGEVDVTLIDKAKLTKELADLLYVVYGAGVAFGLPLDAAFREVHRSNMSKLGDNGVPLYREDGKVLKGPNYTPADIEQFFRA